MSTKHNKKAEALQSQLSSYVALLEYRKIITLLTIARSCLVNVQQTLDWMHAGEGYWSAMDSLSEGIHNPLIMALLGLDETTKKDNFLDALMSIEDANKIGMDLLTLSWSDNLSSKDKEALLKQSIKAIQNLPKIAKKGEVSASSFQYGANSLMNFTIPSHAGTFGMTEPSDWEQDIDICLEKIDELLNSYL